MNIRISILLLLFVTNYALSDDTLYPYCNVFLGTTCFGLKAGDGYKYSSEVDFTLYEVKLVNGDKLNIYSGLHPAPFDFNGAYLKKENVNGYLVSALKVAPNMHRILIEPTVNRTPFTDIHISIFSEDHQLTSDFIRSFKSCTRSQLAINCMEGKLLGSIVL